MVAAEPDNLFGIVTNSAGVETGLCVHVGSTDGAVEIQMVRDGRQLAHGLALDDQSLDSARKAIWAEGIYPLASVEKTSRRSRGATLEQLPYADNLVSLLIADLDALGKRAHSRREMMRVVRPNGIACLKEDGKWTAITKPRPKETDEWTHLDYDAGVIGRQSTAAARPFALPDRLIAQDWRRQARAPENETEPLTVNGRTFIALTHKHQMQCRDAKG